LVEPKKIAKEKSEIAHDVLLVEDSLLIALDGEATLQEAGLAKP
jgi:hypothetical protein